MLRFQPDRVQRKFVPGDRWLSFKIYCSEKYGDTLLTRLVDVAEELTTTSVIGMWFFIRYADPQSHIRFRVYLPDTTSVGVPITLLFNSLKTDVTKGYIQRIEIDTYVREIERYSEKLIGTIEELFSAESILVTKCLNIANGDPDVRWQSCIFAMDRSMDALGLNTATKLAIAGFMSKALLTEFKDTVEFRKELNKKFRDRRNDVAAVLGSPAHEAFRIIEKHLIVYGKIYDAIRNGCADSPGRLQELCCSILHMLCNRFFYANQKCYELVLHDMLFKYYNSVISKQAISPASNQSELHKLDKTPL